MVEIDPGATEEMLVANWPSQDIEFHIKLTNP
ncbi:MAG: hypothetical protein ACI9UA_006105 [Pseudoalteromonas tetraodonis]|jgi:hypothetical protein